MKLFEAIEQMRQLTARNEPFSFTFMSYSTTKNSSNGVVHVRRGLLRKRATTKQVKLAEYIIDYYDTEQCQDRRFYLPLLMVFNNNTITL